MLFHYLELIKVKIAANLKAESSRFYLSYMWWVIEPVLYMVVFYVVFGVLLNRGTEDFVAYLLCGLIPWLWFSKTVNHAMNSLMVARNLILQVDLPKIVLPIITIGQNLIKELLVIFILLVFLLIYGIELTSTWLYFPVILIVQLLLVVACSMIVAAFVPFLPDLTFVVTAGLQLLMFMSGVFYGVSFVPENHQSLFYMNPVAALLRDYRNVLLYNQEPDFVSLIYISSISAVVIAAITMFIFKYDKKYPRIVI